MIEKVKAPFSPGTVANLAHFQANSNSRYECVRDGTVLGVDESGLRCPKCNLVQNWAHGWTALPDPF